MENKLNNPRIVRGWAFFDWANSAYALVITVAIFPAYFISHTTENIPVFGWELSNSALFSYIISFTYLLIALALPLLSGLADYSGRRMFFLKIFTTIGSIACMSLYFFTGMETLSIGLLSFILAIIGFDGGKVFYNSYLPVISSEDKYDKVSAMGFAYGYIGSVLLLLLNLAMIMKPGLFGIPDSDLAVRISFILVGIWWIGFAQIPFKRLPADQRKPVKDFFRVGFREISQAYNSIKPKVNVRLFLWSFFFYSAGVQTVLYLASTFAEKELNFGTTGLIVIVLILQIVAVGGAYLFAWVSSRLGNKPAISAMLVIWIVICILAYFVQGQVQFYILASLVGLVMGGIQSMSRSTYSKLLSGSDKTQLNSFFSFYEVLEKLAIVFGTFSFGLIDQLSGGMRNSVLILGVYFIIGLAILARVNSPKLKIGI